MEAGLQGGAVADQARALLAAQGQGLAFQLGDVVEPGRMPHGLLQISTPNGLTR